MSQTRHVASCIAQTLGAHVDQSLHCRVMDSRLLHLPLLLQWRAHLLHAGLHVLRAFCQALQALLVSLPKRNLVCGCILDCHQLWPTARQFSLLLSKLQWWQQLLLRLLSTAAEASVLVAVVVEDALSAVGLDFLALLWPGASLPLSVALHFLGHWPHLPCHLAVTRLSVAAPVCKEWLDVLEKTAMLLEEWLIIQRKHFALHQAVASTHRVRSAQKSQDECAADSAVLQAAC